MYKYWLNLIERTGSKLTWLLCYRLGRHHMPVFTMVQHWLLHGYAVEQILVCKIICHSGVDLSGSCPGSKDSVPCYHSTPWILAEDWQALLLIMPVCSQAWTSHIWITLSQWMWAILFTICLNIIPHCLTHALHSDYANWQFVYEQVKPRKHIASTVLLCKPNVFTK